MDIMSQKMDEQIEGSLHLENQFNKWLFKVCELRAGKYNKDAHDIYPYIDLTDAKLSFIDGITSEEYSKTLAI
jgi:hypothetical protein